MPPAADRSPPSLSSPLSGRRRIISRLASPFASKSRNFADFCVDVDDPHRQYAPGDVVHGSVKLRVLKPIRVTHIVVCLHGFVQVYKSPGSPGDGYKATSGYMGAGRGKKSGEYFGNGFASLFEDEVVLCGDGRLGEGSYQFNFELEFPDRDLPSSIEFERGTISYMITTTMTRPTTMSPTVSCDRKVYFVERIDISTMTAPKPRTITLEPVSRRTRTKHNALKLVDSTERRSRKNGARTEQDRASRASSGQAEGDTPGSPAPSEISFDSLVSSNGRISQPGSSGQSAGGTSESSKATTGKCSLGNRTITATVESLAAGCLRGDNVAIKVTVNHTKPIKSLYGVIVTLYRQARVDMHPAIPLGPTEKGVGSKYEDYYPKSVTGLGGLSLSGAGASHVFRKDLVQVMVPLYVDPSSLTAEVTAKVRVPDEAFPTISTVPGSMISFKYFVEAVVDIQGKLSGRDRSLVVAATNPQLGGIEEGVDQAAALAPYGSAVIDTAPIRRDKGVITCTFEMVVGTQDSERRKGKRKVEVIPEPEQEPVQARPLPVPLAAEAQAQPGASEQPNGGENGSHWYDEAQHYYDPRWYHPYYHPEQGEPTRDYEHVHYHDSAYDFPPPQLPDESRLSEKERMQRAEARLLPSQPPGMEDGVEGGAPEGATAPYLPEEAELQLQEVPGSRLSAPAYGESSSSVVGAAAPTAHSSAVAARHSPTIAPEYDGHLQPGSSSQHTVRPIDDRQELERRRLQAEASAPPGDVADAEAEPHNIANGVQTSATTAAHTDELAPGRHFDSHADAAGSSELPRYER
ncbi:hypothetical protein LTR08_003793 [Meristemomyces frigidus]|nr:hypothetical protein LTR08_003793 [Meristemomyces frigidus]